MVKLVKALALMVWNIGPGDAVFVPDFTFFASGETPAYEGAIPVFVDVEDDTFNMSPASLEAVILQVKKEGKLKPHVIVAVDLSVTADLCRRVLALPMHPYMTKEEQDAVVEGIKEYLF